MIEHDLAEATETDAIEVGWLVAKRAAAIRAGDAEYLASRYAPGALTFGFAPPCSAIAGAASDVVWVRDWFDRMPHPPRYAIGALTVSVAGDLAFCHSVDEVRDRRATGRRAWSARLARRRRTRLDVTLGYSRIDGVWRLSVERVLVLAE
ncbi:hypothetical protein FLP10_10495 [Agromyces intestinalis]|uniref:SnoaL-like domain-containing protein n=1 Tax=Agromyces intestinalis TaxID=2592652 RepID=A0A5C1YI57_9MICO|nr:nuclear transport factor 2 family protein [Agromyces intestinalis]QEO14789.1 hypothetical protein FLP10_10495 [Agromyces intestinalis]